MPSEVPWSGQAAKFRHDAGAQLRLQCFVIVRDAKQRIALVRIPDIDGWCLPGETMRVNETPDEAARRVARTWFTSRVGMALDRVLSFPATGPLDDKWYLLFVYDGEADGELKATEDTLELTWVGLDEAPPGPFAMGHGDVWAAMKGAR